MKYQKLSELRRILNQKKSNSILLITGDSSYESSGAKKIIKSQLEGYEVTHLRGFKNSLEDIEEVIELMRKDSFNFVIGVGGGTVMDLVKSASLLYTEEGSLRDYVIGEQKPKGNKIKRLLIPTTAGTGAEITPFSVVYIGKTKYSLAHPTMIPDHVILAPELTYSLDKKITAQTGCDALAQAIESFWSINATQESKTYSKSALMLILNNLEQAVNKPNQENRGSMLKGAHLSGKAIAIAKTTAAHALSYPLTTYHNIPHGHAVMLTLPYFFPINEKQISPELLSLLDVKTGEEARDKLLDLMDKIHLEMRLNELGIKQKDLQNIVDNGFNPERVKNNPVKVTEEVEWAILKDIL